MMALLVVICALLMTRNCNASLANVATPLNGGSCTTSMENTPCGPLIDGNNGGIRQIWEYSELFSPVGEWVLFTFNDTYTLHSLEFHFETVGTIFYIVSEMELFVEPSFTRIVGFPVYGTENIKTVDLSSTRGNSLKLTIKSIHNEFLWSITCAEIRIFVNVSDVTVPNPSLNSPALGGQPSDNPNDNVQHSTVETWQTSTPSVSVADTCGCASLTPYIVVIVLLIILYICTIVAGAIYIRKINRKDKSPRLNSRPSLPNVPVSDSPEAVYLPANYAGPESVSYTDLRISNTTETGQHHGVRSAGKEMGIDNSGDDYNIMVNTNAENKMKGELKKPTQTNTIGDYSDISSIASQNRVKNELKNPADINKCSDYSDMSSKTNQIKIKDTLTTTNVVKIDCATQLGESSDLTNTSFHKTDDQKLEIHGSGDYASNYC